MSMIGEFIDISPERVDIPLRSVSRPDWSIGGIPTSDVEESPPEDIVALWGLD
jgi:hypothetical protein